MSQELVFQLLEEDRKSRTKRIVEMDIWFNLDYVDINFGYIS